MTPLQSLLEKIQGVTGLDRELDILIGAATGYRNRFDGSLLSDVLAMPERHEEGMQWEGVPAYTASLDAALALVERVLPGFDADVNIRSGEEPMAAYVWPAGTYIGGHGAQAATAPLALLAALLTALISKEGNPND